ncbi:hypothetical protein V8017_00355 [Stenotrophomonas rhizophila]
MLDRRGELRLFATGRRADVFAFQCCRGTLGITACTLPCWNPVTGRVQPAQRHLHRIAAEQEITDFGSTCTDECLQGIGQLPSIEVVRNAQIPAATMREGATEEALRA